MCLPRAEGCCCRDRECLCQLEQGDALATVFGAPRRARRGEGLKRGLHRCHRGFLCLSPALRCSDMTDVLVVPNTSALSSLSRLFGWDLHSCKCHAVYCDPPPLTFEVPFARIEEVGRLGQSGRVSEEKSAKSFFATVSLCSHNPVAEKRACTLKFSFDSQHPNCSLSLFFFLSIN